MTALFFQSTYEVFLDKGAGYMDSLAGLIFFLLLGRYFQEKTYERLSFERDYKSFFPLWTTVLDGKGEHSCSLDQVKPGNRLLIRSGELVPADAVLIKGEAQIDYSFVTGESQTQSAQSGDKIFAGGKQTTSAIEVEVISSVEHSYLTSLWQSHAFTGKQKFSGLNHKVGFYFTISICCIATTAAVWHIFYTSCSPLQVFTAVVIVACPCALALAAPLAFGFATRKLSQQGLFLKDSAAIEQLALTQNIVFDKTGTLTKKGRRKVFFEGGELSQEEYRMVFSIVKQSGHPVSRQIAANFHDLEAMEVKNFKEFTGHGICADVEGHKVRLGKSSWMNYESGSLNGTSVEIDGKLCGTFIIMGSYRQGLKGMLSKLKENLLILSGDNDTKKHLLKKMFPEKSLLLFNQQPQNKLDFVNRLKIQGDTLMVGDGLNDAGALKAADFGIAVVNDISAFFPACDAILEGDQLIKLPRILLFSRRVMSLIKVSFGISILYNILGISFAVSGLLTPLLSAILMPVSSITILFASVCGITLIDKFTFKQEKLS